MVEHLLPHRSFVPNDSVLDHHQHQLVIITGPNMAVRFYAPSGLDYTFGTYGELGAGPSATIPLTDRIFVRSGAADMITAGLSTFMVEMVETAQILQAATSQSLIIMDEIGRGTSTYDGISLAWSIAEHLVTKLKPGPKTLFATHYHELQALADKYPHSMSNAHLAITHDQGRLVFLYQLVEGGASHSYGVMVAEQAGLPSSVINHAKKMLVKLENQKPTEKTAPRSAPQRQHPIIDTLAELSLENLTPLQALTLLADWKTQLESIV